jgi:lipopolysaccharide export system permease protein
MHSHVSRILSAYIARQFALWFSTILAVLLAIVLLFDVIELLRRASDKPNATFDLMVGMGVLSLPEIGQDIFPFAALAGGMYTFWRLTRSQELVVARASGISAWQFMAPALVTALMIGVLAVGLFNPIFSAMLARYEQLENRYLRGQTSSLEVSRSGLWLRQLLDNDRAYLIHAESVVPGSATEPLGLRKVMVLLYDGAGAYSGRLDAASATLEADHWELRDGYHNQTEPPARPFTSYSLPTDFTLAKIEESFASPKTLSFWDLPAFIATLERTGLSSVRHRLYYQSLLAKPALFAAMVLLAAAFTLRHVRHGGTLSLVATGVAAGFALFILNKLVNMLGISGTLPVVLAAWAPTGVAWMLGAAALLHLEDG